MLPRKLWSSLAAPSAAKALASLALFAVSAAPTVSAHAEIAASAQKQIAEIVALKRSMTPAEKKLSFNLVLLERDATGKLPADLKHLINYADVDRSGNARVAVRGYLNPRLLSNATLLEVDKVDGKVPQSAIALGRVHARVSARKLLALAEQGEVRFISDAEHATTNVGAVTSQGYVTEGANRVVAGGVTGQGINVGVLSDSATPGRVAALIASGDLPANVTVLPGQAGSGEDEGTAMMEIVHDMAPGANLFFATAFTGEAEFADNIRQLRYTYHCDVIVDDITYFDEPAFQDGTIAQAVNDVTKDGALYVSSAANSGNLSSGTSGTWEGDFQAGPTSTGVLAGAGILHNFGTASNPVYVDTLKASTTVISLKWSDPQGGSGNDYDLYVLDPTGTSLVAVSGNPQTGTQDPFEIVGSNTPYAVGDQIVVAQYAGSARALRIDTNRGQLTIGTTGSTYGHNAAASAYTAAAVYWNSAHAGTRPFSGGAANPVESFSSDGLRKVFFNPDGSAITPGNFLFATDGGTTLQKPDGAAADGVVTSTPGFNPFYGTSAAAPHIAGIAALVKSANPSLSNQQIRQILNATALDNMAPGTDRDSGVGILWAPGAVASAKASAQ